MLLESNFTICKGTFKMRKFLENLFFECAFCQSDKLIKCKISCRSLIMFFIFFKSTFLTGVDHVRFIGNMRLKYRVTNPSPSLYQTNLEMALCVDGICTAQINIIRGAMFSLPKCNNNKRRRRKRQA